MRGTELGMLLSRLFPQGWLASSGPPALTRKQQHQRQHVAGGKEMAAGGAVGSGTPWWHTPVSMLHRGFWHTQHMSNMFVPHLL